MIFYSPPQKFGAGNDKQTTSQTPPKTSKSLPDASSEKPEIAYKPPRFPHFVSLVGILGTLTLLWHVIACCWYGIGVAYADGWVSEYGIANESMVDRYLRSIAWTLSQFNGGSLNILPQNPAEHGLARSARTYQAL